MRINANVRRHKARKPQRGTPKYPVVKTGPTGRIRRAANATFPAARAATLKAREERAATAAKLKANSTPPRVRALTNSGTKPNKAWRYPYDSDRVEIWW